MSHPDSLLAALDANVLYPQWLRDVQLTLAAFGYYEPRWSQRIIDEMRRNVLDDHPDIEPERFDAVTVTALLHLATNRRSVDTIADLLTTLEHNQTLRPFMVEPRRRLL